MIMLKGFKTVAAVSLAALSIGVASTVAVDSASARSVPSYLGKNILFMALHNISRWVSSRLQSLGKFWLEL